MKTLSTSEFTEEYMDILLPLESLVSFFFQENPSISDHDIAQVYEALSKHYKAKLTNSPLPHHKLEPSVVTLYETILIFLQEKQNDYSFQKIQDCIKTVLKSVKRWNERHGLQGYLNFISRFF